MPVDGEPNFGARVHTHYTLPYGVRVRFRIVCSKPQVGSFSSGLGDGWGLTTDGQYLIATESSEKLHFIDPATMKEVRTVTITDRGHPIKWVNEVSKPGSSVSPCGQLR